MAKRSIVPFGPQHPVLPEPVHLDLVLEDETVVGAIPSIGYVHRGLEKLVEKRDFKQYSYIAEHLVRDEPYPQPSALAGASGRRHGIRESFHGELEAEGEDPGYV